MTEKFTQWFPATTKPVHEGYYDTRAPWAGVLILYWDGSGWRASATSPRTGLPWLSSNREWRGLSSPVVAA